VRQQTEGGEILKLSKYTTELRYILETYSGISGGYDKVFQVVDGAVERVFDFSWPIWDESYRNVLSKKILLAYYTREICVETVGLWKLRLSNKLNEIMPYYNQLYRSATLEFNPFYDVDLTTTHQGKGTEQQDSSETGIIKEHSTDSKTKNETGNLSKDYTTTGTDSKTSITNDVTASDGGGKDTTSGSTSGKSDTTEHTEGKDDVNNNSKSNTVDSRNGGETTAQSDTPQGALDNVLNKTYLSFAEDKTRTEGGTSETTGNTTVAGTNSSDRTVGVVDSTSNEQTVNKTNFDTTTYNGDNKVNGTSSGTNKGTETNTVEGSETGSSNRDQDTTKTGKVNANTTDEYIQIVKGKNGGPSYSKLLMEYRETMLNIDKMVLDELDCLFMQVW